MSYQVTDVQGVTRLRPGHADMVKVAKALYQQPPDTFAEVTLTHASGVAITLYPNGTAVMDEADTATYAVLDDLSIDDQLMLWLQLASGHVQSLRKLEWRQEGHSSRD
jgi:hypothetical protein